VSAALMLLVTCVVVLTAWLTIHVGLVIWCVRDETLERRHRVLLVLCPPCTPWFAWKTGHKRAVIGWACLIVLYVALRMTLGAR
jgi:hypothetical protein